MTTTTPPDAITLARFDTLGEQLQNLAFEVREVGVSDRASAGRWTEPSAT